MLQKNSIFTFQWQIYARVSIYSILNLKFFFQSFVSILICGNVRQMVILQSRKQFIQIKCVWIDYITYKILWFASVGSLHRLSIYMWLSFCYSFPYQFHLYGRFSCTFWLQFVAITTTTEFKKYNQFVQWSITSWIIHTQKHNFNVLCRTIFWLIQLHKWQYSQFNNCICALIFFQVDLVDVARKNIE